MKDRELGEKDEQIRAWIDEAKRKDMLIAHLQERIVELPPGTPERPESHENSHHEPQTLGRSIAFLSHHRRSGGNFGSRGKKRESWMIMDRSQGLGDRRRG